MFEKSRRAIPNRVALQLYAPMNPGSRGIRYRTGWRLILRLSEVIQEVRNWRRARTTPFHDKHAPAGGARECRGLGGFVPPAAKTGEFIQRFPAHGCLT